MSYLFAALAIHSVVTNGVSVRWFEERVPMSDGVALYTYGVLPSEGRRCALILERSPYVRRRTIDGAAYALSQQSELKRGYAYVRQHVRGSGMSEGELVPGTNDERRDGLDTLAWLRTLPHYGGEVYLAGASYLATVHWSYLSVAPDDVKGAWLTVQDLNRYNMNYRNGNYKIALHGNWVLGQYKKNQSPRGEHPSARFTDLPLAGLTLRRFGEYSADPEEFWAHPRPDDDWWRTAELAGARQRRALLDSKIPVMMVTGFYDIYTEGIFDMWRELPLSRRANCALVVDDGEHGGRRKDIDSALDWFDWCRGKGALKLVRPGETVWLEDGTETWHHAADMTDGAGREAFDLAFSPSDFTYDPRNPPPFDPIGCLTFGGKTVQQPTGWRSDVIVSELPPFARDLHVQGRMKLSLRVTSDCEDTSFYVRLSVKKVDGKWYSVRDDIKTLLWDRPTYSPGESVALDYTLSDIAIFFAKGDVLRLEVAGASPKQFVPHTNFKGPFHLQKTAKVAHNRVDSGRLTLPVKRESGGIPRPDAL